jgi:hypothetical protein
MISYNYKNHKYMGIKNLNKFITTECLRAIKKNSLQELSGKKIAIDISIYIFKYSMDKGLLENMYLMLSLFKYYNIIPIFIFDGKRPAEKKELLEQRREDREKVKNEYNILQSKLDCVETTDEEKQEIINSMHLLSKKLVIIKKEDFENVKKLITAFGNMYFEAPGEADELCAYLCIKGKVWGCLSEDMDMFVYGCPRVIRHLSLLNTSIIVYNQQEILHILNMCQKDLREICVLSGTDYNIHNNYKSLTLYQSINIFNKYKKSNSNEDFYIWVLNNTKYIEDYELLIKINKMFSLEDIEPLQWVDQIVIKNSFVDRKEIVNLLSKEGFIFPI